MHRMNSFSKLRFLSFGILVSLVTLAEAELIQLKCEIRSVDAKDRSIVAFRSAKEIKLNLAENVSIMVNDRVMQIEDLPAPIEAAIEYETKLEVITKIEASKKVALENLILHLDQQGDLRVWVNGSTDPEVFQADSFFESHPGFGDAGVEHQSGSRFRVRHDFSKQSAKEVITREGTEITVNPDRGVAVIVPQSGPLKPLSLHRSIRAPFHIKMDFRDATNGRFSCILDAGSQKNIVNVDCALGKLTLLSSDEGIETTLGAYDLQFQQTEPFVVSVNKKLAANLYNLQFALQGNQPVGIRSIDIVGAFPVSFGARIERKGENVMVVEVIKGSAAEEKLQVGDIIRSVNQTPVVDLAGALSLFADCTLGKEVAVEVQRLSESKMLLITPR
jgi:hypothetical protein